mmetsp:Transcript_23711/g.39154  ORF Transcript_23711/g.39154 Transcript_23711/m.39154 type:complete len:223 (+) Transcript_23711:241-909(+)
MTEVEQMALSSSLSDTLMHCTLDLLFAAKENGRVNVALDKTIGPERLARSAHVDRPIKRDDVARHVALELKIAAAAVGVIGDRHIRMPLPHYCHSAVGIRSRESGELYWPQMMRPRLEKLDDLCAAFNLMAGISTDRLRHTLECGMQDLRTPLHHLLAVNAVTIGLALDRISDERERAAHKTEQRRAALRLSTQIAKDGSNERELCIRILKRCQTFDVVHAS